MTEESEYISYEIISLGPLGTGWRAMYRQDDGSLFLIDVHLFAMARATIRNRMTNRVLSRERTPVGLQWGEYCWDVIEEASNFAGYLAPGDPEPEK